ncbi:MAG: PmoA family protein [Verrucomicrobiota bacterium]|nr:PmoA family protein [Verrucomicrobiota bacterium]
MTFRFFTIIIFTMLPGQMPAAEFSLRIDAGQFERINTPVRFILPKAGYPHWKLVDVSGQTVAVQANERKEGTFIIPRLAAFETATYKLSPVSQPTHPAIAKVTEKKGKLRFTIEGHTVLHYQAEKSELPRADLEPIYRRGGYLHPVLTPNGTVITDDYPHDHKHHHGIWFPWTNTIFEGRNPDFWNMGKGTGTVEFAGLLAQWNGPVHAGFLSTHRFVDLIAKPKKIALNETWRLQVFAIKADNEDGNNQKPYHLFELESAQRCAGPHKIKFPKYRYGGLGFRGHGEWNGKQNSFFLTSNGESNRIKSHATRARWCHISGKTGGKLGGIGILCHPSNFRFPQPMRIHPTEPFFNFAPSQTGDWEIKPNDDYVSRYRFVVTDGKPDTSLLDRLWNDYAQPPRVEIYTLD